ncbi:hypothetical protein BOTBODRAFT_36651 [Botryobasidium botryosum FD-172 SS1]|uniref:Cytochrome P450 n=1 Tax=Botryobasidium botryosum (strain FD-172 SS1) TaxID=930990 RepID=A0A067MDR4_BOTB1|nr:hypothetical protein BOTBODRAFT_36651 [Botryobasidium botryosum FD-172 SS1]
MNAFLASFVALLLAFVLTRIRKLLSGIKAVDNTPGLRCAFSPRSVLGQLFRTRINTSFFCNPGTDFLWLLRRSLYKETDIVSVVPYIMGKPLVYVSAMEALPQITGFSSPFDKQSWNLADNIVGENIVTAQKEKWKRHRKILSPAFSQKTYESVWDETRGIYRDMVASEGWGNKSAVFIPVINDLTAKFSLAVLSTCAFGIRFPWSAPMYAKGEQLTVQECFHISVKGAPIRALAPSWAFTLPLEKLRNIDVAFKSIFGFIEAQIAHRRATFGHEACEGGLRPKEAFNLILNANEESAKVKFQDSEVVGNTFTIFVAGYETVGRVLAATFCLLGLYQEEQERVYQEIMTVLPDGRDPTVNDFESFAQVQRFFFESMRLYPPAVQLVREATEDVVLNIPSRIPGGLAQNVAIKKGTVTSIDILGINYNPRHFPEPESFKPSRWENPAVTDMVMGFGYGPRLCLGRKFALVEVICFLVMFLRDWKIEVDLEEGETREDWRERMMTGKIELTFSIGPLPIRLTRRI